MSKASCIAWRKANPIKYSYQNLKSNAKRRGKFFDLTFEQFLEAANKIVLFTGKGKQRKGYEIDCVINDLGYTKGNLQRLKKKENAAKGAKTIVYDIQTKALRYVSPNFNQDFADVPF